MTNINKLLIALTVIFVVVLLGEGGYYVLYLKAPNAATTFLSRFLPQLKLSEAPASLPIAISSPPSSSSQPRVKSRLLDTNYAISSSTLETLAHIRKGILVFSTMTNSYQGEVLEIDTKEGVDLVTHTPYGLRIKLAAGKGNSNVFWFSKEDVKKIRVSVQVQKDTLDPLLIDQLKVGDRLYLTVRSDLLKDTTANVLDANIIKLK